MQNEERRKIIEEALGQLWPGDSLEGLLGLANRTFSIEGREAWAGELWSLLVDALAEQAFAVDCDVEHTFDRVHLYGTQFPMTIIKKGVFIFETLQGHHGREGKALAIIVSVEEE